MSRILLPPSHFTVLALLIGSGITSGSAAISYGTVGGLYTEGFDGLPTILPSNANIQAASGSYTNPYVNGWQDDTTTVDGDRIGVPGWYLYHTLDPGPENGANDHQRVRVGPGANTGSFWIFGATAASPEKALGSLGSATVAGNGENMYIALRLVNGTAMTLNEFTLTFDGEQWRDGQSASPETMGFGYSLSATAADWFSTGAFTSVAAGNVTSPVFGGTGTAGTAVDGNAAGRIPDITVNVTGIAWAPGSDLWLRWGDPQLASLADDGLAIDNVRFVAVPVPEPAMAPLLAAAAAAGLRRRRPLRR